VDADSICTKYPFPGHASSQSISPSLRAGSRRINRYFPPVDPLHLKLLARLDIVLLTNLGRQYDLTFAGNTCGHTK
jgi:hypothetical protein